MTTMLQRDKLGHFVAKEVSMAKIFVPVRMHSSRLPGKPLKNILGKSLLEWSCESIIASGFFPVVLAPDEQIIDFCRCRWRNIDVIQTSLSCRNGTERVAEACNLLNLADDEIIVNCQGDMFGWENPLFLTAPIEAVQNNPNIIATVYSTRFPLLDITVEDTVKVLRVKSSKTKFNFTRASTREILPNLLGIHFGIYVATRAKFRWYAEQPPKYREEEEGLEQLRWKASDILAIATTEYPIKVDTPEDLIKAENILLEKKYGDFDDPL